MQGYDPIQSLREKGLAVTEDDGYKYGELIHRVSSILKNHYDGRIELPENGSLETFFQDYSVRAIVEARNYVRKQEAEPNFNNIKKTLLGSWFSWDSESVCLDFLSRELDDYRTLDFLIYAKPDANFSELYQLRFDTSANSSNPVLSLPDVVSKNGLEHELNDYIGLTKSKNGSSFFGKLAFGVGCLTMAASLVGLGVGGKVYVDKKYDQLKPKVLSSRSAITTESVSLAITAGIKNSLKDIPKFDEKKLMNLIDGCVKKSFNVYAPKWEAAINQKISVPNYSLALEGIENRLVDIENAQNTLKNKVISNLSIDRGQASTGDIANLISDAFADKLDKFVTKDDLKQTLQESLTESLSFHHAQILKNFKRMNDDPSLKLKLESNSTRFYNGQVPDSPKSKTPNFFPGAKPPKVVTQPLPSAPPTKPSLAPPKIRSLPRKLENPINSQIIIPLTPGKKPLGGRIFKSSKPAQLSTPSKDEVLIKRFDSILNKIESGQ